MKVVLMLLLLANLGFFAWQQWYGGEADRRLSAGKPAADVPRLVLVGEGRDEGGVGETAARTADGLSEAGEAAVADESELSAKRDDRPASRVPAGCATLGPFETHEIAEVARERLALAGFRSAVRESGGQIRSGFWVYLPPLPSRDAAEEIEDALREKGVHDLFIVADSDQRNAISLGLFSTPERADQRAAEIGRLGYSPRVAERFRDAMVYWVDFVEQPGERLEPESVGVMGADDTLPEKHAISCAGVAVDAGAP